MTKQTVNLGTSPNKGDGDPIRTAMRKINDNFDELYAGNFADPENTAANIIPSVDGTYDIGSADTAWADLYVKDFIYLNGSRIELTSNGTLLINGGPPAERQDTVGSVFADDSTILVDGLTGKIVGDVLNSRVVTELVDAPTDDLYVTAVNDGSLYLGTTNTRTVIIGASDTTVYVNGDDDSIIAGGQFIGDLKGSVFGDDSTVLVDSVAGKIVGDVENNSVITGRVKSQDDIDLYVFAGGTGAVILAGQSDLSIGHTSGQTDIYGDVEFNNGTTAFQSGNDVEFNCPVDFTNATITMPQYISLADLKTEVAAATDFIDFQARIAAL